MISYLPIPGGHIKLAERFVDGAFSFVRDFALLPCGTLIKHQYSHHPDYGLELLVQLDNSPSSRAERSRHFDRLLG